MTELYLNFPIESVLGEPVFLAGLLGIIQR